MTHRSVIDKEPTVSNYFVKVSKDNSFAKQHVRFLSAGTFYEDFDMNFDVKDEIYIFMMRQPGSPSFTIIETTIIR
jgi:hypothetical protein